MKLSDLDITAVGTTIQIAGVVYSDGASGKYLVAPLPGESDAMFDKGWERFESLEMDLPDWEKFIQQTDRVEVMALVKDEHGDVGKAIVRKSARQISQNVSWAVYRRDFFRCSYCSANDVPLTVDHLVLWEEGGPSIMENLATACKKCNRTRGEMPYAQWLRSPEYRKVSANLPGMILDRNEALVGTLAGIPRHPLKGKRKR